jgi:Integrase core domain
VDKPNQRWSLDFMHDQITGARSLRLLTVIDEHHPGMPLDRSRPKPLRPPGNPSGHIFLSVSHARRVMEEYMIDYNEERPHSALGGQTPGEYARSLQSAPP